MQYHSRLYAVHLNITIPYIRPASSSFIFRTEIEGQTHWDFFYASSVPGEMLVEDCMEVSESQIQASEMPAVPGGSVQTERNWLKARSSAAASQGLVDSCCRR